MPRLRLLGRAMLAGLLVAVLATVSAPAPAQSPPQVEWHGVSRVIAFADVHGADVELVELLREAGVIDSREHWSAGAAHVVSLGDLLDRGAGSRRVMDLLMRLQSEAVAAGGRLHVLLGNHEAMNLMADLRYVGRDEFAAYADLESPAEREAERSAWDRRSCTGDCPPFDTAFPPGYFGHRAAFAPGGTYGRWLLSLPVAIKIDDTLFMHAGPAAGLRGLGLGELNLRYRTALAASLGNPDARDPLLADEGPNWYRGPALCNEVTEADVLLPLLQQFGATRLVIGHTPTRDSRVVTRFGGRVVRLDTGMNRAAYRGRAAALVIEGDALRVHYAGEAGLTIPREEPLYVAPDTVEDAQVLEVLRAGLLRVGMPRGSEGLEVTVDLAGRRVNAMFRALEASDSRREVAAFRLDRALRLGIVPATIQRRVAGRDGVLQARPQRWFTQKEAQSGSLREVGWCSPGPQFQLMYALDTLAGNDARTASTIIFDPDNARVLATSFDSAFGAGTGLPRYLRERPPTPGAELRRRLAALDQDQLDAALEGFVGPPARQAILRRRDALLALPAAVAR